jgi:TonB-dependent receptor
MKFRNPLAIVTGWLALVLAPAPVAQAADGSPLPVGAIEGRVYNAVNGAYLNNARVSLDGTDREVQTNSFGEFRFDRVPVGPATVRVVVSGFPAQSAVATVAANQAATLNFGLSLMQKDKAGPDKVVVLDRFVVESQREMSGSAIAINERRVAPNLKNVVASDEFGDSPEGNVAEFLKLVPGVSIGYNSFDARTVEVRGLPAFGTAVSFDGAPISSGTQAPGRETEFNQASLNNTARIEVIKSPLPDTRADTIGGSVNIVSKSAFDFSRPVFTYRTNLSANLSQWDGGDYFSLGRLPFSRGATRLILPGFDVSYIRPITKNLGLSLSATASNQFTPEPITTSSWRPTQGASTLTTADRPFLAAVGLQDGPKMIYRRSFGATFDWRVTPQDVLNVGVQVNYFRAIVDQDLQSISIGSVAPTSWGPTFTQGAAGAGSVSRTLTTYDKRSPSYTALLKYRHNGSVWTLEGGVSLSESWSKVEAFNDGVIKSMTLTLPSATFRYDDIQNSIPHSITSQSATGGALDWRALSSYRLSLGTSGNPQETRNGTNGARASAARVFGLRLPVKVKVGADVRREHRDYRSASSNYTFVGPDRVANTADDFASRYDLLAESWSTVSLPFGLGRVQRPAADKLYGLLQAHPEYWTKTETSGISSGANTSQKLEEIVAATYLRADTALWNNRLKLVGGLRYEATYDQGQGLLNDLTRTYQKDATGRILRDANGTPLRVSTDATVLSRLQYTERGAHAKRDYADFYPSLNASFLITDKLMFRAAYARTITRPQLSSIIPSITATDPTTVSTVPTITVTNTGLRPWYANSFDVGFEYYFDKPGVISVGAFRKDIRNFFGSVRTPVTLAQLEEWGFDDSFTNYDVVTTQNIGSARVSGLEYEYRQTLTWLPARVGNVIVYFNSTAIHVEGASANSISGFLPLSMNYGATYSNSRLTARLNWNLRGRTRAGRITGTNVEDPTYTYNHPRRNLDFNAEFRVRRSLSLFVNVRNLTNVPWRQEAYGPNTPPYARGTRWVEYGPNALFGIKGTF